MAVTLTAVLLTASNPQPVQITLNGTTSGQAYTITGTTADGASWSIPGGVGVSSGGQVVVTDNRSPLNVAITYQVVVAGVTYTAAPVTVSWSGVGVLQTLDGQTVVGIEIASVREPRKFVTRGSVFEVAGRRDPAARLDVAGSAAYSWQLDTQSTDTAVMESILASGNPVVRRLVSGMRDLRTVVIGIVGDWSDELISEGGDTWRRFTIAVREISDPQPSAVLAAYVWDDFDKAMAQRVWSYHSTLPNVSGLTATNGTLSSQATGGYADGANSSFGRLTVTTAGQAASVTEATGAASKTLGTPVAAGMVVTKTARVKGTPGRTVAMSILWSGGTSLDGASVVLTGAWQQISVTGTAPAGTTECKYVIWMAATGVLAADQLDWDAVTISQGTTVPVGAFDEIFTTWDQFDAADWAQYF